MAEAIEREAQKPRREFREDRPEIQEFRRDIRRLNNESAAKDRRINALETEKSDLARRLEAEVMRRQRVEYQAEAITTTEQKYKPKAKQGTAPDTVGKSDAKDLRFTLLSCDDKGWVDISDNARNTSAVTPGMHRWRANYIAVIDLTSAKWEPTRIVPFANDCRYKEDGIPAPKDESLFVEEQTPPAQASSAMNESPRRPSPQAKTHGLDWSSPQKAASARKRKNPFDDPKSMGPTRKAVCVQCWESREYCNSNAQCRRCKDARKRCVYRICDSIRCRDSHCPRLHPGQWDEDDERRIVDKGRMLPKK
ncbi:hypothetical protein LTR62_008718 [Meristemomyces frigidus]|uniref:Uncharacterized protein n=1 Tax=Meristemomyces frigidus TaxID=1508187 RepID=A0AAN7THW6_9PEZI|nr:hypothetical protein LTR62_008718 [Meristemomyces frigidus]